MTADDFSWRHNFPFDRTCQCDECPECCPGEYERYAATWDAFYAAAEARIAAGELATDVLDTDENSVDDFTDAHFNGAFDEAYEADALRRFPGVAAYWAARRSTHQLAA